MAIVLFCQVREREGRKGGRERSEEEEREGGWGGGGGGGGGECEGGREVRSKLPPYPTEIFMSMSSSP